MKAQKIFLVDTVGATIQAANVKPIEALRAD
jgi:hypothetical protein